MSLGQPGEHAANDIGLHRVQLLALWPFDHDQLDQNLRC
jgi:hypothetical protein